MTSRLPSKTVPAALLVAGLLATACQPVADAPATVDPPLDRPAMPTLDPDVPTTWLRTWAPEATRPGYLLDFWNRRVPTLFDRAGRVVHRWPQARMKSRVRLEPDGSILGLALGPAVHRYDWQGDLIWQYRFDDELPHHDVIRLVSGNLLVITRRDGAITDDLVEIDEQADQVVWRWRSEEHLGPLLERAAAADRDSPTHFNSVQELPPNRWFDGGDQRFRPGNLLVSSRNLNTIMVVDRNSGEIAWNFSDELDLQHEALMVPPDAPRAGNILVLSNGTRNLFRYRQSALLEIDPSAREIVWRFATPTFFTTTGGVQQPLPNGNVLLTSTRGGRVFEIDGAGSIVWEWTPPFDPTRARWVSPSASAPLRALHLPEPRSMRVQGAFVERRAYRFGARRDTRRVQVDGADELALREPSLCSRVFLPYRASIELRFRVDPEQSAGAVRFRLTSRRPEPTDWPKGVTEFDNRPRAGDRPHWDEVTEQTAWESKTIDLSALSERAVVLCVDATGVDTRSPASGQWLLPGIRPGVEPARSHHGTSEGLSDEEAEAARRHLEAMGYVN